MSAITREARWTTRAIAQAAAAAFVALVVIACMVQRSNGRAAVARAEAASGARDLRAAIAAYRVAAEARCPLVCDAPPRARIELGRIADDAEERRDLPTALAALRSTRAALLSSVVPPDAGELRRVERRLAHLSVRADGRGALAEPPSDAAREERLAIALGESPLPGTAACTLFGLGAFAFLAASLRFVFTRSPRAVELVVAAFGIGLAVLGLALF